MSFYGETNATPTNCPSTKAVKSGIFCNYDPGSHNADLVLISCPSTLYDSNSNVADDFSPSLGCIYVASSAAAQESFNVKGSFRVKYIDGEQGLSLRQIVDETLLGKPRIIGINYIHRISSAIVEPLIRVLEAQGTGARIVIGGISAMLDPHKIVEKYPNVVCCSGEGEKVIRKLLNGDPLQQIDGITFVDGDNTIINPPIMLKIADEEDIQLLYNEFGAIFKNRKDRLESVMLTSRGCQWKCAFCSTPNSMGSARYRNLERVIQDIAYLHNDYQIEVIHVYDDVFIASISRMRQFVQSMKHANLDGEVVFKVLARADILSRFPISLLHDLKDCGISRISIGIESGNNRMLQSIKRGITTEMVLEALLRVKQAGIRTKGFFMFGLPDETINEMIDTFSFARYLRDEGLLDDGVAHFAKAYPGTEWERDAIERGKQIALSDNYIPVASGDGSQIRRNPAIPKLALSDVDKEVILDYIARTNNFWPSL